MPWAQPLHDQHQFLCKSSGFYGANNLEAFRIDEVVGLVQDLFTVTAKIYVEKDPVKKVFDIHSALLYIYLQYITTVIVSFSSCENLVARLYSWRQTCFFARRNSGQQW